MSKRNVDSGRSFTTLFVLMALVAACGSTPTRAQGPGIRWIGSEDVSPSALLAGTLTYDDNCVQITALDHGDVYGLVLASDVDTSEGVVDSSSGAPLANGATVTAGGGEVPHNTVEEGSEVAVPSSACLIGKYWYTRSLTATR